MKNKKIDNDLNSYLQGQKLAQEVSHIMAEEAREDELTSLTSVMLNNPYADEFVAGMSDSQNFKQKHSEANACANCSEEVERLVVRLKKEESRVLLKKRLIRTIGSVAAVLLIFFLLMTNIDNQSYKEPKLVGASGVCSQASTPILIKEDGSVVNLLQKGSQQQVVATKDDIKKLVSHNQMMQLEANTPGEIEKIIVPRNYTYVHQLSDNTWVYLNAGSELIYPSHFTDGVREVILKGEAYFKVSKSDKPFIVNTSHAKIKVYGTEFNVNTEMNGAVETVLLSGSVGVTFKNEQEVKIEPNQLISFNLQNGRHLIREVNAQAYVGWLNGYFLYENGSFDRIIADLSAWYGIEIYASLDVLEHTQLSFSIPRSTSLEGLILIIEDIANVKFINEGGGRYTIE